MNMKLLAAVKPPSIHHNLSSYKFKLSIIPKHEHNIRYEKIGVPYFSQIQDRNTQDNLCKKMYPSTIKYENGSVAMRKKLCNANGTNNPTN